MTFWEKALLLGFGFLLLNAVIFGGATYLHKKISEDAVAAYKLTQSEAANAELQRVTKERDDANALLSAQKKALQKISGGDAPVGNRTRHIARQLLCDRSPRDCAEGFTPTSAGKR